MIIEFIGTPGAGKTTLVPCVIECLRERGICARTLVEAARPCAQRTLLGKTVSALAPVSLRHPLLWQVFYYSSMLSRLKFSAKHPGLIGHVLSSQSRRPSAADLRGRRVLHWFFHLVGCYEFLTTHRRPGEAFILDEGFIHRVVQLHASDVEAPDATRILAYVDLLSPPDLVIVPRAPLEVCEQRVCSRGVWRHFRHKSPAEISRYIANAYHVVELTVDYIKRKGWIVIEVDNSGEDLSAAVAELRDKLALVHERLESQAGSATIGAPMDRPPRLYVPRPSRLSAYIRSHLRPLDIEFETVRAILDRYELELIGAPANLPLSRRTRNVLVHTSLGKKVLKLHRSRHQIPAIIYGHSILTRLDQLGFPTTRPVTTPGGETLVSYAGGNYALYDFVDGINYSSNFLLRRHRLALMRAAGWTLARLHRRLEGFMPAGRHHLGFTSYTGGWRRDLAWFTDKVGEMKIGAQNLGDSEDQAHADWLIRNCDSILAELARSDEALRDAPLPRVVIHGDYGLHNLIFRRDGMATVLDFESARVEWRLSDLVSGLSRLRYASGSYDFESIGCFMAAYQAEYPLSADEWRLFPQVWRFYKLRSALIYWNSYFETGGPARKLISARDAVRQADWALNHPQVFVELKGRASI